MSPRSSRHYVGAALLLLGMIVLPGAKPPELPAPVKVNCKENDPAAPEWRQNAAPPGAIEMEESSGPVPSAVDMPIDTLYPWLDALLRACEEQAEVWLHELTEEDTSPAGKDDVCATASRAVRIVDGNDGRKYSNEELLKLVRDRQAAQNLARIGILAKNPGAVHPPTVIDPDSDGHRKEDLSRLQVDPRSAVFCGPKLVVSKAAKQVDSQGCPFCQSMKSCWASIVRAARVCLDDLHECFFGSPTFGWMGHHCCPFCQSMNSWAAGIVREVRVCLEDLQDCHLYSNDPNRRVRELLNSSEDLLSQYLSPEEIEALKKAACEPSSGSGEVQVSYEVAEQPAGRISTAYQWQPVHHGCPFCRSMKPCWASIVRATRVCAKDLHACFFGCEQNGGAAPGSEAAEPVAAPEHPEAPAPETTCPYLQQKQSKTGPCETPASIAATPLENLKKLERGQELLEQAECAQAAGQMDTACELYQKVQYLCPGSRLAATAEERVKVLSAVKQNQSETPAATEEESRGEEAPSCPFLKEQEAARKAPKAEPLQLGTPLENLEKLSQARKLFQQAQDNCYREDKIADVQALCREIHRLCPGSPIDRIAQAQFGQTMPSPVQARMFLTEALESILAENYQAACSIYRNMEQQWPVHSEFHQIAREQRLLIELNLGAGKLPRQPEKTHAAAEEASTLSCTEQQVAELLEDCQRALADGHYRKAAKLARQAQALDPECVAANALVFKTHLLIQVQEKARAEKKKPGIIGALVPLCPHMPAIDPAIVEDLERALTQHHADVVASRRSAGHAEESESAAMALDSAAVAHVMQFVHSQTGVEVDVSPRHGLRVRYECHSPAAISCFGAMADGLEYCLTMLSRLAPFSSDGSHMTPERVHGGIE
jgi:tetratricopeptide (TPR) repeat protein